MNAIELENKLKKFGYNLSNRAIANIIGITEQYYSNKKKNGTDFKQADIEKIENKFNISLMADLAIQANNSINITPLIASCGNGVVNIDIDYMQFNDKCKYSYIIANGDSMQPVINDEDFIIIRIQDYIEKQNGIYCFSYGDEQYCKYITKDLNYLLLSSANKKYDDIKLKGDELNKIKIIGEVVGLVRKFN